MPLFAAYDGKYPFSKMELGDSFFVFEDEATQLFSAAVRYKKRNKEFNYTVKRVEENKISGRRIWRIPKKQ